MSWVAKLLSFVRTTRNDANVSDVTIDTGGGENHTVEHFAPPGDDSYPLVTDYVLATDIPRSGSKAAIGYIDPVNTARALEGDKIVFARDPATGLIISTVWLHNDGTIEIVNDNGAFMLNPDGSMIGDNGSGSYELEAGGDFVVNGVTIDASGNVIIPTSLNLAGKEIAGHSHPQGNDSAGDSQVNTGPNL